MARRGENIYLRKDGRYEGRYCKGKNAAGKTIWGYVYAAQYQEVKRKLITLKAKQQENDHQNSMTGSYELYGDWAAYWLEMLVRPHVKQSTYLGYKRTMDKHLLPVIGNQLVREIQREVIQEMINQQAAELAPGTVQNIGRLLSSSLKEAAIRGLIGQNPCQNLRLPKTKGRNPRVLTLNEQKLIEEACIRQNEIQYLLGLYAGLRLGEICALTWEDINIEEEVIMIRYTLQRISAEAGQRRTQIIRDVPKTEASCREIPVPSFLMNQLHTIRDQRDAKPHEYVFQNKEGGAVDPRVMQRKFVKLTEALGIKEAHMHTLRHTYATRCLEKKIGYEILSALLGHSSPKITLQYYAHCTREIKKESVQKLNFLYKGPDE